jgi:hypothetical protein
MPESTTTLTLTLVQRKLLADLLPEFTARLKLDQNNSRTIPFTPTELEEIRTTVTGSDLSSQRHSHRLLIERISNALETSAGIGLIPASGRLYQFKITLAESAPPIWRRIQVKDSTLDKFHERIQTAMGWTNSHLHQFDINGQRHGNPELLDDGFDDFDAIDSTVTRISDILPPDGSRFRLLYEYDFGDGWEHEVLFEGCLRAGKGRRYPLCVEGERKCPPEDVGGIWGYGEFLEALADPKHERHAEYVGWGRKFDPEEFDTDKTTGAMRRGLPKCR